MSEGRRLFGRYLQQMRASGEEEVMLDEPLPALRERRPDTAEAGTRKRVAPSRGESRPMETGAGQADRPPRRRGGGRGGRNRDWREGAPPIPPAGIVVPTPASDLFSADELAGADLDGIAARVAECRACRLCQSRSNTVPGEGPSNARLVVVGEGPGATEDETGRPFVGRAGELLTDVLRAIDLPREEVFICNVVKCRPPDNRKPLQDEIDACVAYLYRQLEVIAPKVIMAMGGTATETLLGTKRSLASLRNRVHSFRGVPLIVTYHPAALLRNPNWKKPTWDDVRIARQLLDQ